MGRTGTRTRGKCETCGLQHARLGLSINFSERTLYRRVARPEQRLHGGGYGIRSDFFDSHFPADFDRVVIEDSGEQFEFDRAALDRAPRAVLSIEYGEQIILDVGTRAPISGARCAPVEDAPTQEPLFDLHARPF